MKAPRPLRPALFALATAATTAAFAQTGPVAHWPFESVERGGFRGTGSAARPAEISGTVENNPGTKGKTATFTATAPGQLLVPVDLARLSKDAAFTLDFWLRLHARPAQYGVCIDAGGHRGFVLRVNNGGRLSLGGGDSWNALATQERLLESVWVHVALVHEAGTATLYVDGRSVGSIPVDPARFTPAFTVGSVTERGRREDGSPVESTQKVLDGDIDELRLHARAVPAGEIPGLARPPR